MRINSSEIHNNHCWVSYLSPFKLIVPDDEEPLEVPLTEINDDTYDHSKLCRIVSSLKIPSFGYSMVICYDGAIALPKYGKFAKAENAVDFFNDIFFKLLLAGLYCEAIDMRDIVNGQMNESKAIWPVDFGHSAESQMRSKIRLRVSGPIDSIRLSKPDHIKVSRFHSLILEGSKISSIVTNLTPKFLLKGVTEIRYKNWDLVLSNLWIVAEQLIDFIWNKRFLNRSEFHPTQNILGRKESFKEDNRTWSVSVKLELLYQMKLIDEEILSNLSPARKARNKLVHEGKGITESTALELFAGVNLLLLKATNLPDRFLNKYDYTFKLNEEPKMPPKENFRSWKETFGS